MKKQLYFITLLTILLITLINQNNYVIKQENYLFHKDVTKIEITNILFADVENFYKKLYDFSAENNVAIYLKIYDGNDYNIFTTDGLISNKISLKSGKNLQHETKNYLSFKSEKNSEFSGQYNLLYIGMKYIINPLNQLTYNNVENNYYITTTDVEKISDFQKTMSTISTTKIIVNGAITDNYFFNFIPLLILLFAFVIIGNMYHIIAKIKEVAIKKINGWTNNDIADDMIFTYSVILIKCLVLSIVFDFIYQMFHINFHTYIPYFINSVLVFMIYLILMITIFATLTYSIKYISLGLNIKDRKNYIYINILNYFTKFTMISFFVFTSVSIYNQFLPIYNQSKNFSKWEKLSDYYYVPMISNIDLQSNNIEDEFYFKTNLKNYFYDLESTKNLIYIDSQNYEYNLEKKEYHYDNLIDSDDNQSELFYKSIKINKNYLQLNPIFDSDGNIVNLNVMTDNTLYLLVPILFKSKEAEIIDSYLKEFRFQVVDVENIYLKAINKPIIINDNLKIEIIYTKNDQNYFSYNVNSAIPTNNYIKNPIAMVINKTYSAMNFDNYINNTFVKLQNSDPFDQLLPIIKKNNLEKTFKYAYLKVEDANEWINIYKKNINHLSSQSIIISLNFIAISIFMSKLYVQEKSKLIMIEKLNGYNHFSIYKNFYVMQIFLYILSFIALLFFKTEIIQSFISLIILFIIELMITTISFRHFNMENITKYIKGDK